MQPICIKYTSKDFDIECCLINFYAQAVIMCANPSSTVDVIALPLFTPNDYFFKHHQKEGEEQWETFARAVRQIMSEELACPLSEYDVNQKYEYRKYLYPNSKKAVTD